MAHDSVRRLVIDTDGGIDDVVALWWALTDPRVELVAVLVTCGNVPRDVAATNVARVLHAARREDVPVALGASQPVGPAPLPGHAVHVHGGDGLAGFASRWPTGNVEPVDEPAPVLVARLVRQRPGELDLVTIGPLSTVAQALAAEPELASRVRSLTVMGGAVGRPGNALPWGEFNVAHDPEAAAAVVRAAWPDPPLLVGLDLTMRCLLHDEDVELVASSATAAAAFVAEPLRAYGDVYQLSGQVPPGRLTCHDLLAVLAAVEPAVVTEARTVPLAVDTGRAAAWGATVADLRPVARATPPGFAPWRVALGADEERFRQAFRRLVS